MAITPVQRNRILQLDAWGHAPAAIAARMMLRWQVVAAVLGEEDETIPAAERGGEPPSCGPSLQGSLLSDPGGSDRPMRAAPPAQSHAKPEEVAPAQAEATAVAGDARPASVAATDGRADDAGSRASGGAGAAAPNSSAACKRPPGGRPGVPSPDEVPAADEGRRPKAVMGQSGRASRLSFDPLAESEAFLRSRPASAPRLRGVPGRAVLPEDLLSAGRPLGAARGRR